jgi:hypothetical protein
MTCEKCWGDAYLRSRLSFKSQAECYTDLLKERINNPCTPEEQAGEYWDENTKSDKRYNCT